LSNLFTQAGIKHSVLNAKHHEQEATIIADAGRFGAVTIATNMAGRGTDIVLGGNLEAELEALGDVTKEQELQVKAEWKKRHDQILELGGLMVIGSERHESRRIDNQLRGRSGRQGDVGVTRFYLSLDDDLMRRFASEKVKNMMRRLGMTSDEAIEHKMVTKSIERAQKQVERLHQDERANLLKFDDISNEQRKVVYAQRNELMSATAEDVLEIVDGLREQVVEQIVANFIPPGSLHEQWNISGLEAAIKEELGEALPIQTWLDQDKNLYEETLIEKILSELKTAYEQKMSVVDESTRFHFEKEVILRTIDQQWRTHLAEMDYLRRGIHLRGYAQKDPFQEYRKESSYMFEAFLSEVTMTTTKMLALVRIGGEEDVEEFEQKAQAERPSNLEASHPNAEGAQQNANTEEPSQQTVRREMPKVGRNDPCPCGSGKKYKQCCGKLS
jgi:preprotein translocase subunit SecA